MGTVKDFEDLEIWKMSRKLVNGIYSDFRECRDYSFRDQITRAGVSIMNNISEGFCRSSDAEFRHFLNISKGSAGEVKNMYYIAEDQKFVDNPISVDRRNKSQQLINSISALMKYLNTKNLE
ncbi:MAG: four helix bundle protein [Bacteroidales bacterium]|nr:four helix bundle protein [Bacteroidales bacterium]MBK7626882.1 four helix bundle protein [Bacteroidales bacterium]